MRDEVDVFLQTDMREQMHREDSTTRLDDKEHMQIEKKVTRKVLSQHLVGLKCIVEDRE